MNMTAIAIVAIACWTIVAIVDSAKSNKKHKISKAQQEDTDKEIAQLKARVETLERIVTDDKYQLNKEFDNLK